MPVGVGAAHPSFCGRSFRFESLDAAVRKRPSDAFVFVEQNLACSVRCIQMFWAATLNLRFGCRPNHL